MPCVFFVLVWICFELGVYSMLAWVSIGLAWAGAGFGCVCFQISLGCCGARRGLSQVVIVFASGLPQVVVPVALGLLWLALGLVWFGIGLLWFGYASG